MPIPPEILAPMNADLSGSDVTSLAEESTPSDNQTLPVFHATHLLAQTNRATQEEAQSSPDLEVHIEHTPFREIRRLKENKKMIEKLEHKMQYRKELIKNEEKEKRYKQKRKDGNKKKKKVKLEQPDHGKESEHVHAEKHDEEDGVPNFDSTSSITSTISSSNCSDSEDSASSTSPSTASELERARSRSSSGGTNSLALPSRRIDSSILAFRNDRSSSVSSHGSDYGSSRQNKEGHKTKKHKSTKQRSKSRLSSSTSSSTEDSDSASSNTSESDESDESFNIPSHVKEEIIRINVGGYRYTTTK